jgi:acetyl-CoA C-acetyltransferase/acetyl-CoA acyltransferase
MTEFGPHDKPLGELFSEAAIPAMEDAGVGRGEVDAFYLGNTLGGMVENETHLAPRLAGRVGLAGVPCQRFEDACATSTNAFKHAVRAVGSGIHDVALVGGVERCTPETGLDTPEMTKTFVSAADRQYEQPTGVTFPGVFGLLTKRHMHEYGTTEEDLAHVAVKNHANGKLNPRAHFGKTIGVDEVLDSPLVADPFRLMDCCPFSDGASAVVVASDEYADSFEAPVDVTGVGHATDVVPVADKERPTATQAARDAASQAYEQAGVGPDDIDVCELHDCFTGAEVLAIEALGFFADGEGRHAAAEGWTALNGDIPVNPSGGLNAKGHPIGATGTAQIVELTEHLRGVAGDRQVDGAETGLAHNVGGDTATTLVSVMEVRG